MLSESGKFGGVSWRDSIRGAVSLPNRRGTEHPLAGSRRLRPRLKVVAVALIRDEREDELQYQLLSCIDRAFRVSGALCVTFDYKNERARGS